MYEKRKNSSSVHKAPRHGDNTRHLQTTRVTVGESGGRLKRIHCGFRDMKPAKCLVGQLGTDNVETALEL